MVKWNTTTDRPLEKEDTCKICTLGPHNDHSRDHNLFHNLCRSPFQSPLRHALMNHRHCKYNRIKFSDTLEDITTTNFNMPGLQTHYVGRPM